MKKDFVLINLQITDITLLEWMQTMAYFEDKGSLILNKINDGFCNVSSRNE
jgi:hypothetical protein